MEFKKQLDEQKLQLEAINLLLEELITYRPETIRLKIEHKQRVLSYSLQLLNHIDQRVKTTPKSNQRINSSDQEEIRRVAINRLTEELVSHRPEVIEQWIDNELHSIQQREMDIIQQKSSVNEKRNKLLLEKLLQDNYHQSSKDILRQAELVLGNNDVRKRLCAALQAITGDVFTVANTLAGCIATGILGFPITPVLVAAIALYMTRVGIVTICAD